MSTDTIREVKVKDCAREGCGTRFAYRSARQRYCSTLCAGWSRNDRARAARAWLRAYSTLSVRTAAEAEGRAVPLPTMPPLPPLPEHP